MGQARARINALPVVKEVGDVRVVVQEQLGIRGVAFLVAAGVGSAVEPAELSGISHLIEHTAFKGTETRSALQIKLPIERVGGHLNALTSRVATVYYFHVPREVFDEAADILLDLYSHPLFERTAVELEKSVVLEEIRESQDEPTDVVFDQLTKMVWSNDFGKPVLGSEETVSLLDREDLVGFHRLHYVSGKTLMVAFGNISFEEVERHVEKFLKELPKGSRSALPSPPDVVTSGAGNLVLSHKRDLNQVHVVFFKAMPGRRSKDRAKMDILNTALGSGMSSLLFERVREKCGLAYTIGSDLILYRNGGGIFVYASTSEEKFWQLSDELRSLFERLINEGLGKSLFDYGKNRLIGGLELSSERALSNAFRLLDDSLNLDRPRSLDEVLQEIEQVELEELNSFLRRRFVGQWYLSVVAPEGFDPTRAAGQWKI